MPGTSRSNPRLLWRVLLHLPATSGFTLIEALVALILVAIVMAFVTPPIFMVTASRVQDRRAEQARQLGQAEIDRVRAVVERGSYTDAQDLPTAASSSAALKSVPAATAISAQLRSTTRSCNTYDGLPVPVATLLQVDVNGDCESDFLVQSFRTAGVPKGTGTAAYTPGFRMLVRVYADLPSLRSNLSALKTEPAALSFTSGLGGQSSQPLIALYSTIVRNDTSTSLNDYRKTLNPAASSSPSP